LKVLSVNTRSGTGGELVNIIFVDKNRIYFIHNGWPEAYAKSFSIKNADSFNFNAKDRILIGDGMVYFDPSKITSEKRGTSVDVNTLTSIQE
jgi:hypothetical protein